MLYRHCLKNYYLPRQLHSLIWLWLLERSIKANWTPRVKQIAVVLVILAKFCHRGCFVGHNANNTISNNIFNFQFVGYQFQYFFSQFCNVKKAFNVSKTNGAKPIKNRFLQKSKPDFEDFETRKNRLIRFR